MTEQISKPSSTQRAEFSPLFEQPSDISEVFKQHYLVADAQGKTAAITGQLKIICRWPLRWFGWTYRWLGNVPLINADDVPVTVEFSEPSTDEGFSFKRQFGLSRPYQFRSRIKRRADGVMVEHMARGICWLSRYHYHPETDQQKAHITVEHVGYQLHLFGRYLPLPVTWLLGAGDAIETIIDEQSFSMKASIQHPLLGEIFSYSGVFKLVDTNA